MRTKRSHEGYLMIDNRNNPGVDDAALRTVTPALPPGAGRGMFEAPTITCSHCQTVLVLNPLRTRDRGYCPNCDHYVCDGCAAVRAATGVCRTFNQVIDEAHEAVIKQESVHG